MISDVVVSAAVVSLKLVEHSNPQSSIFSDDSQNQAVAERFSVGNVASVLNSYGFPEILF